MDIKLKVLKLIIDGDLKYMNKFSYRHTKVMKILKKNLLLILIPYFSLCLKSCIVPIVMEQTFIITPALMINITNTDVNTNEEIILKIRLLDVYDKNSKTNWHLILKNLPNNIEIINGIKNENLSQNNLYFIQTEQDNNDGFVSIKFSYEKIGNYDFSINLYKESNLSSIKQSQITNDTGELCDDDYTYKINVYE